MVESNDRKILDFVVRQHGLGTMTDREAVVELRQVLRESSLPDILPLLPGTLAKLLMDSLKVLGRLRCTYPPFSEDHWRALAYADSLLLFSLLPEKRGSQESVMQFHGYPVLGEVEVRDPETFGTVIESLRCGIYGDSIVKRCWEPHHGLRAIGGGLCLDLVMCFRCECMQVFTDPAAHEFTWADIGKAPEPVLNRLLSAACVTLAKQ